MRSRRGASAPEPVERPAVPLLRIDDPGRLTEAGGRIIDCAPGAGLPDRGKVLGQGRFMPASGRQAGCAGGRGSQANRD